MVHFAVDFYIKPPVSREQREVKSVFVGRILRYRLYPGFEQGRVKIFLPF